MGSLMALPSTVTHFSTSGIPVLQYLARHASVVQFRTTAPASSGSLPSGNYRAGGVVNQHLFTALGIYARKRLYSKAGIRRCKFVHLCDALGLVLFDADDDVLDLEELFQERKALLHEIRLVEHGSGVAGDIRFALRAVDNNSLYARKIVDFQLDRSGESRAAKTYQTAVLYSVDEVLVGFQLGGLTASDTFISPSDSIVIAFTLLPELTRMVSIFFTVPETLA